MIKLTLITQYTHAKPEEFDTDDLGEALAQYGERHFKLNPDKPYPANNAGPDAWIIAFVVERNGVYLTLEEQVQELESITSLERYHATRPYPARENRY